MMKTLSYSLEHGQQIPEWNDKELLDVFIALEGAKGYGNVLETLQGEYDRLNAILDEFSSRAKGSADVVRAAELYRRILFFKIQALKGHVTADKSKTIGDTVTVKDLQIRYGIKSRQGVSTWLARNLDIINQKSAEPVKKSGKYWRIPVSALPVIDMLRRGRKER